MKHTKTEVMCRVLLNGKMHKETKQLRVVYHDKKGAFVRVMGNKRYVENRVYEQNYTLTSPFISVEEVIAVIKEKASHA